MIKNRQNKITLTLPDEIYKKLNEEKNKFSYTKIQEVIYEVLRDRFLRIKETKGKSNRGRPSEDIDYLKAASRKNIFKKGGKGRIL